MKRIFIIIIGLLLVVACGSSKVDINSEIKKLNEISKKIDNDFNLLVPDINETASYTETLYQKDIREANLKKVNKNQYELTSDGIFYRKNYKDTSAVFVSGYVPIDEKVKETVYFTEPLDKFFIDKVNSNEAIVQIYYNDKNSYNRIYPGFDVLSQYQPKMDIPSFNFYYLADEKYNPTREAVWVNEPYVDPAGRGWMISVIKPVYSNGSLEGVTGIDITINEIIGKYLVGEDEDILMLSQEGTIIAVSENIAEILLLPSLKDHKYIETIKSDTYLPENFNLLKSKRKNIRSLAEEIVKGENNQLSYEYEDDKYTVIYSEIDSLDWIGIKFIKK